MESDTVWENCSRGENEGNDVVWERGLLITTLELFDFGALSPPYKSGIPIRGRNVNNYE